MVTKKRKLSRSDSPVQQRQHGVTAEDNTDEEAEDDEEEEEEEEGEEPEGEGEEGGGSGEKINRGPRQKKSKKGRNQPTKKRATPEQTAILEAAFQSGMIPDQSTRRRLAAQLGFPERRVQIWFQVTFSSLLLLLPLLPLPQNIPPSALFHIWGVIDRGTTMTNYPKRILPTSQDRSFT